MGTDNEKNCKNCYFGRIEDLAFFERPCGKNGCFENKDHPDWEPFQNIDRVHEMTAGELTELFYRPTFPKQYHGDCNSCWMDDHCDYLVDNCPETFRKWLGGTED